MDPSHCAVSGQCWNYLYWTITIQGKGNDLPTWHHRPHELPPSVIKKQTCLHWKVHAPGCTAFLRTPPGENQRGCHRSSVDQSVFTSEYLQRSQQLQQMICQWESSPAPTEYSQRLTTNFSRSIKRPFLWHENTPHCISAITQQTSFSDYSTEAKAAILNFKVSSVFRFPHDGLITTSITTVQKYHNWKLGPKLK